MQNWSGLHLSDALSKTDKNDVQPGAGHRFLSVVLAQVWSHERQLGFQRARPLAHDLACKV